MRQRAGVSRIVAVVAIALGVLAGCGDDGSSSGASSTSTGSSSTAPTTVAPSSSASSSTTSAAPTTTAPGCVADLTARLRAAVGREFVGGTAPVPGGTEEGGVVVASGNTATGSGDTAVGIYGYDPCKALALVTSVRREGSLPVWRLVDAVVVAPGANEIIALQCKAQASTGATGPAVDGAAYVALVRNDYSGATYPVLSAWRVRPGTALEPADVRAVSCPVERGG